MADYNYGYHYSGGGQNDDDRRKNNKGKKELIPWWAIIADAGQAGHGEQCDPRRQRR